MSNGEYSKCMKTSRTFAAFSVSALSVLSAQAQGFQNLNFESANVAASGVQPYGTFVPIGSALPGWTGYLDSVEVTQVGYNSPANSTASITLIGPTWNSFDANTYIGVGILDGNYSVDLQTQAAGRSAVTPQYFGLAALAPPENGF
jgi:hypothetical protein